MSHDGLIHPAKDCVEQIAALEAQNRQLREALTDALPRIKAWAEEAYPEDVFPPPDWDEAKRLLGDSLLSRVSAANMRHVAVRMWEILRPTAAALAATEPPAQEREP